VGRYDGLTALTPWVVWRARRAGELSRGCRVTPRGNWRSALTRSPAAVSTVAAACSDCEGGEVVAVELGEVVGCHQ
jgi:hypothetical protein